MSRATAKHKPGERRHPVPANYPIAAHLVPDMPAELFHLAHTGALMASEREEYGWHPLLCADCEGPLDLIYRHETVPLGGFKDRLLPGFRDGEDVTPICPRCSFKTLKAVGQ